MNILINISNLKKGGGIQVAESVIEELHRYPQHYFVIVYSDALSNSIGQISTFKNIEFLKYDLPSNVSLDLTGRNSFLDNLVEEKRIDTVLTVFGPSRWRPKVTHVCGFARAQIVLPDSPFWHVIGLKQKTHFFFRRRILKYAFNKSADALWSESSFISYRLKDLYPSKRIYTVTNTYNQVYDNWDNWDNSLSLPAFDGISLLTVSANYPHKNLPVIIPTIQYLKNNHPDLKFRFVLTINETDYPKINVDCKNHIVFLGAVKLDQCPFLYEQCDIMFLPTLLECFSANYVEAMKMKKPILTSNLEFVKSLCADAAMYIDPMSPESIGEAIVQLAVDKEICNRLVENGVKQLASFDTYKDRAQKLIRIMETEFKLQVDNGKA